MAAIVAPFQIFLGDPHGLNTLEHQPAKVMAKEGHYESHPDGAPLDLFGKKPARFLLDRAGDLSDRGRVLAVADGEGRNSVFLAGRCLDVTAFDASPVAVEKACALAVEFGVSVRHEVAGIENWDWTLEAYDAVVAIFIQFAPPQMRMEVFRGVKRTLKPGGVLLLHGYRPEQIRHGSGGPPHFENMYTDDLLRDAFGDMRISRLATYDQELEEGTGHSGMSALIDLVAFKV